MPKKMGINSKAVEARERKAEAKKAANDKAAKAAEDALWIDDDKQLAKKKKQKEEEERRKAEAARKKAETKALLEQEMNSIKTAAKVPAAAKVTRSQIESEIEKRNRAVEAAAAPKPKAIPKEIPIEENLNRVMADTEVAQTIDQAIAVLSVGDASAADRHPEKRMKAAYKAYEEEELKRLKQEHPSLKLSQLKQMIFKNWQKAPENPMNQI